MTAEGEEVVVGADPIAPQNLGEQPGQRPVPARRPARGTPRGDSNSGSGSAA